MLTILKKQIFIYLNIVLEWIKYQKNFRFKIDLRILALKLDGYQDSLRKTIVAIKFEGKNKIKSDRN